MEQLLRAPGAHQDSDTAQQISNLELTERLSSETLARLQAKSPGPQTSQQLELMADRSAFLSLPAAETPSAPPPPVPEQRKIMALVVDYVSKTLHQMPNFLAERHIRSFVDRPDATFSYQPLRLAAQSSSTILYRDGKEVLSPVARKGDHHKKNQFTGLVSSGEFGPILSIVLLDAAHSELVWSHWESGKSGSQIAVFRYRVPSKNSHYDLNYTVSDYADGFNWLPTYHGELAVDPASGAILRLTTVADLNPSDPLAMASIAVEYGPVEIAGQTYICPIRSVALAQKHSADVPFGTIASPVSTLIPLVTLLNEVQFTNYHVFRGEARIITGEDVPPENNQPSPTESTSTTPATQPPAPPDSSVQDSAATTAQLPPAPPPSETENKPAVTQPPPALAQNEPSPSPVASPPSQPADSAAAASDLPQAPIFRSTTREVILDVVVTRKDGDPVTSLSQQAFTLTEDGKAQHIDFFEEHQPGQKPLEAAPQMPPLPPGAVSNAGPTPQGDAVNVLLIDTLNTEGPDQSFVHSEVDKFLQKLQPGTQVAIFVLGSKLQFVQGFTSDTAQLIEALKKNGNPKRAEMAHTRGDTADDAQHIATLEAMQASPAAIAALKSEQQAETSRGFGDRAAMTFEALDHIAHYLEGVPGRKNLIWFAGSFPVVLFPSASQAKSIEQNPGMHGYMDKVKRTAGLFTDSKIAVYPIGAQGVMTEHMMEADSDGAGGPGNTGHAGSAAESPISPFTAEAGQRAAAVTAMQQLAASTGGKAFNTNDLNDAMHRAINDGAHYYTLGYSPANSQSDGSFRRIAVNLTGGKYKLAYRSGYYADSRSAPESGPATDPLRELLAYGLPNSAGVLYAVQVSPYPEHTDDSAPHLGQNTALKGPTTRYRLDFTIRASDLEFVDANGRKHAQILTGIKVYDSDGNPVNWLAEMKSVDLPPTDFAVAQKSGLHARLEIDLPEKKGLQLVTAIYDWNSRHSGTLNLPLKK